MSSRTRPLALLCDCGCSMTSCFLLLPAAINITPQGVSGNKPSTIKLLLVGCFVPARKVVQTGGCWDHQVSCRTK